MFVRKKVAKRFSLLLLEDEEDYVADWVVSCSWPSSISGNWQGLPALPGRLRLCTKSMFFDPDDVRVPIARSVAARGHSGQQQHCSPTREYACFDAFTKWVPQLITAANVTRY